MLRPTYQELLPVLWEMGILPEIRILPSSFLRPPLPQTRTEAIDRALVGLEPMLGVELRADATLRRKVEDQFDTLFDQTDRGFQPRSNPLVSSVLITWEPVARP